MARATDTGLANSVDVASVNKTYMDSDTSRGTIYDTTARRIVELTDLGLIREPLMLVWNARGAADMVSIDSELVRMMGASGSGRSIKNLDHAFRTWDRP